MSTELKAAPKKVVTGEVRASYVNIFKTRFNDLSGKEEYSMMILIPKEDRQTIEKIEGAIETAKVEKWNDKLPKNLREPLKDGDDEDQIPESAEVGDERAQVLLLAQGAGEKVAHVKGVNFCRVGVVKRRFDRVPGQMANRSIPMLADIGLPDADN